MTEMDAYILRFDPQVQQRLIKIRNTALEVFGDVEEILYHGMPTVTLSGRDIMNFGAYRNHIAIHFGYEWKRNWRERAQKLMDELKKNYPQYPYTKYTMQLPHTASFPDELIRRICVLLWQDRQGE